MYTQCPDCSTAFRVTADVLKQAAGKVRCGGCGNAFNALAYLSESMPEHQVPAQPDGALPELQPEAPPGDALPASISAEQSAALLKTLDELAGSDIRIEDTGVEWRVLDDDEIGDAAADEAAPAVPGNDLIVDEVLDESPTPVDQFLTDTPPVVDAPEIFEEPANDHARTSVDEIRFDDNTPLPEDFALDDDGYVEGDFAAEAVQEEPAPEEPEDIIDEEPQTDVDLSEPGEWTDILGEFAELAEAVAAPAEAVLDALDEPELPEQPEEPDDIEIPADVLDEVPEAAPAGQDLEAPLDMDSQFALQAEAMGIDLTGSHEALEKQQDLPVEDDVDLDALLSRSNDEDLELEDLLDEDLVEEVGEEDLEDVLEAASEDVDQLELIDENDAQHAAEDDDLELDEGEPELDAELPEDFEEDLEGALAEDIAADLEAELSAATNEPDADDEPGADDKHFVPPLTEEEQTINMQIDQDLLALAVEDEDGFASTIIIPEAAAEDEARKDKKRSKKREAEDQLKDTSAGFETIIMEGEAFRSADDPDKLEADSAAAAEALAGAAAVEREAETAARKSGARYGLIGGIVLLVLVLAGQYVHQARDSLATIPAFNKAIGPLYRALGQPLSPDWDITGWRFEATKGSTDEGDANLTIFSRVGNKSDKPLPYPLIGISLTDRFEETIGSRVLDPAEYLSNDLDPRKLVEPGNTFNAVITIESPDIAAASFRLRACYRTADDQLRCKDDGFK